MWSLEQDFASYNFNSSLLFSPKCINKIKYKNKNAKANTWPPSILESLVFLNNDTASDLLEE